MFVKFDGAEITRMNTSASVGFRSKTTPMTGMNHRWIPRRNVVVHAAGGNRVTSFRRERIPRDRPLHPILAIDRCGFRLVFSESLFDDRRHTMANVVFRKQISIFLPLSDWKALRQSAAEQRIPMTELCRRWMEPGLRALRSEVSTPPRSDDEE